MIQNIVVRDGQAPGTGRYDRSGSVGFRRQQTVARHAPDRRGRSSRRSPTALSGELLTEGWYKYIPVDTRRKKMSVAKTSEISASSSKSFEDAIQHGIRRMSKTVDRIESAWIKEQKVVVKDGDVEEYRVTMKVTFVVK